MTQTAENETTETPSFPLPRSCPFSPPDGYADLRDNEPVSRSVLASTGRPTWLVTRHADVKAVLGEPRVSADIKAPGYPLQVPVPDEVLQTVRPMLLSMDPPDHTAQRRMLIPEFTVHRMRSMRPGVQKIVDDHIDALVAAGGPVDLVTALSLPIPSLVVCELLGVPYSDHARFESWSAKIMSRGISQEEYLEAIGNIDGVRERR